MSNDANAQAAPAAESTSSETVENNESNEASAESESSESSSVQANTESELESEIQEAIDNGASQEQVKNMIREFTLKVNGKEYQRKIDLNDEETLRKELQLAMAGRHAMQENAELKKWQDYQLKRLKDDPFSVLAELGYDPIDLSAKKLNEFLAENEKTPEQREIEARQKRYKEMEEELARIKKEQDDAKREAILENAQRELQSEISAALDKYKELDETPELVAEIAEAMFVAMDDGWDDVRAEDVIPSVHQKMINRFKKSISSLKSKDAIKSLLGEDVLKTLREERIEQAKKVASVKNLKTDVSKIPNEVKKDESPKIKLSDILSGRSKL